MSISDRLGEIEARASRATEGPWEVRGDEDYGFEVHGQREPSSLKGLWKPTEVCAPGEERNAEFIAHARTDVPDMLAALRAVLDLCDSTPLRFRPYDGAEPFMVLGVPAIRAEIAAALGEES